jgi:hypothetical protein
MNLYSAMRRSSCLVTDYTSDLSVRKRMLESFTDHEQPLPPLDPGHPRRCKAGSDPTAPKLLTVVPNYRIGHPMNTL